MRARVFLFLAAPIAIFSMGCAGTVQLTPEQQRISGVYAIDVEDLLGQGRSALAFSFDETSTDVDGGVRIVGLTPPEYKRVRALHEITLRRGNHVEGTVELAAPYGATTFRGDIQDKEFVFTLTNSLGSLSGRATRIGEYRRPGRLDWTETVSGYQSGSTDPNYSFEATNFDLLTSNVVSDNMGGYDFSATTFQIPTLYPLVNGVGNDLGGQAQIVWRGSTVDGSSYSTNMILYPQPNDDLDGFMGIVKFSGWNVIVDDVHLTN